MRLVSGNDMYVVCDTSYPKLPAELPGRHCSLPSAQAPSQSSFKSENYSHSEMGGFTASLESKAPSELNTPEITGYHIYSPQRLCCGVSGDCTNLLTSPIRIISHECKLETCFSTRSGDRTGGHNCNLVSTSPPFGLPASQQLARRSDGCCATPPVLQLPNTSETLRHSMLFSGGERGDDSTTQLSNFSDYRRSEGGCRSAKNLHPPERTTKETKLTESLGSGTPLDNPVTLVSIHDYQCESAQANHCDRTQSTVVGDFNRGGVYTTPCKPTSDSSTLGSGLIDHAARHPLNELGSLGVSSTRLRCTFMEPHSGGSGGKGRRGKYPSWFGADLYNASRRDAHNVALSFLLQQYGGDLVRHE